MAKSVKIIPASKEQWPTKETLRAAAYCRVSTACEEQIGSLEAQQQFYASMIEMHPDWSNAGIFSDQTTGLNAAKRPGFQTMLRLCRKGKIDLILTKSFSRLGRSTLDMMKAIREFRRLKVDVYFEKEGIWLHQEEAKLLITAYCALSQAESESMSQNIKWGIHRGFRSGTSGYADFVCFGYKRGDHGELAIDELDAIIVRQIFQMKAGGHSLREISNYLYEHQILSPTGKERWSPETIRKLLRNEKYTGDVRLQKTFVEDIFTKKRVKNMGQLEKYLLWDHHPAIIGSPSHLIQSWVRSYAMVECLRICEKIRAPGFQANVCAEPLQTIHTTSTIQNEGWRKKHELLLRKQIAPYHADQPPY